MSTIMTEHYAAQFRKFEKNGAQKSPAWVHDVRKNALSAFSETGFPTTKAEEWKYTNVGPIAKAPFQYSSAARKMSSDIVQSFLVRDIKQHVLTFVDGHFSRDLSSITSLPAGVIIMNMAEAVTAHEKLVRQYLSQFVSYDKNPFTALNTAFMNDGVFCYVPENIHVDHPVHLLFLSTQHDEQIVSHIRNLIIVEEGAKLSCLCSYHSVDGNKNLTNAVTEIIAKKNSEIEFVKVQKENDSSYHVENLSTHQFKDSNVHVFSLALGGAIARNDMSVIIDGEKAECNLNGLYVVAGEQLIDHHTFMHHIHPNCPSHELFKGILTDKGRAVFNGKVYVEAEAQKTDSKQTNRNLVLSDTAIVDTKPELEIFADDVKCTHGAAVGGLNESHSFYLKTRGISAELSKTMLTVGFAAEATGKIRNSDIQHHVDQIVVDHLREKLGNADLPEIVHR